MIPGIGRPGGLLIARSGTPSPPPSVPTDITLSSQTVAETSADVVAANTVIGTLGASGGTAPYTFSIQAGGTQFDISGTSLRAKSGNTLVNTGSPYSVTVRVEDSATPTPQTYDEVFSITVLDYTDAEGRVVGVATMHSFDDSNPQPIYGRIGLAWPQSPTDERHWPAGYRIKARVQGGSDIAFCALASGNSWDSGAKRSSADNGVVFIDENTVSASGSRIIEFYLTAGSQAAGTFDPWAWITAHANDLTVELTNFTRIEPGGSITITFTTAPSGSAPSAGQVLENYLNGHDIGTISSWDGTTLVSTVTSTSLEYLLNIGERLRWNENSANNAYIATISGSTTVGDKTYSLKTAIGTTTRREIVLNTTRFCRVKVWQKVAGDEHLIIEWHLDFWLDGSGNVLYVEWSAVPSQHFAVDNPFGTTQARGAAFYTATVKYGSTTVDTRTVSHAYHQRWASLYSDDNSQHARKHCLRVSDTTIIQPILFRPEYDDATLDQMMRAGAIPPVDYTVSWTSMGSPWDTLLPMKKYHSTRWSLGDAGGYEDRGMWGVAPSQLLERQSRSASAARDAWRAVRTMSTAMLSLGVHLFDHRVSVSGGTDATNKILPRQIRPAQINDADQQYPGLGQRCIFVRNGRTLSNVGSLTSLGVLGPIIGGSGSTYGYTTSHSPNYSSAIAFLEGERIFSESQLAHTFAGMWLEATDFYDGSFDPYLATHNGGGRQTALGYPAATATTLYGTGPRMITGQVRGIGWVARDFWECLTLLADDRVELPAVKNLVKNTNKNYSDLFNYLPAAAANNQRDYGGWIYDFNGYATSPWMHGFQFMGLMLLDRVTGDWLELNSRGKTGIREGAELAGRYIINRMRYAPGVIGAYNSVNYLDRYTGVSFLNKEMHNFDAKVDLASDVFTVNPQTGMANGIPDGMVIRNGDRMLMSKGQTNLGSNNPIPTGLTENQNYYLVNVNTSVPTAMTYQISATEGGSAITGMSDHNDMTAWLSLADFTITPSLGGAQWGGDSYPMIAVSAFEMAIAMGHPDLNSTIISNARAFYSTEAAAITTWNWRYNGDKGALA